MKPSLAYHPKPDEINDLLQGLTYPVYGSMKIDGIRVRKVKPLPNSENTAILTKSGKSIANIELSKRLLRGLPDHTEGELVAFTFGAASPCNVTQAYVNTRTPSKCPVTVYLFDYALPRLGFDARLKLLKGCDIATTPDLSVVIVPQVLLCNPRQVLEFEEEILTKEPPYGEGIVLRGMHQNYISGRCTKTSGAFIAIKRREDGEATITGIVQRKSQGRLMNAVGAFSVDWNGVSFEIGSGLTDAQASAFWHQRDSMIGRRVEFSYAPVLKDTPRHPVFKKLI